MSGNHHLTKIIKALLEFDAEQVKALATAALADNISPVTVIEEGIAKGLREIGQRYEEGTFFVTHLVAAAEAARAAIDDVLTPALSQTSVSEPRAERPKVVLATVQGDIHDIGKNIVGAMLFAAGFEVIDLGKDVSVEAIIAGVKEHQPALLGLSSLLSTTMQQMPKVINALEEAGLRDSVKVMVGGGAVTEQWAKDIGADGYGANAAEAVTLAKQLLQ